MASCRDGFAEIGSDATTISPLIGLSAVRESGEVFPVEASISILETGREKFLTLIIRDLTERIQAEIVRRRLAAIVESSNDAIVSTNLDAVITSWNPAAQRMYGYTEAEALGQSIMMLIPDELGGQAMDILRGARAGESIEQLETVRVAKTGKKLTVSVTVSPFKDSTGAITGVSSITRDVSEQKRAEESLRESEERFRLVANTAPVMIWMSGLDKLCTYFNEPWLNFRGRSLQQEMGQGWVEGIHCADLAGCLETYQRAFDRREPFQMEYRLRRNDGEYIWVTDRGLPRFSPDGTFLGYIGSCVEITERRLAEEALSSMSRKLIEAQEQERTWIARELHDDINQRLALLAVNLDRLKQELPRLDTPASARLDQIRAHVSDLGSDVQTLSHRLHSSKLEYLGIVAAASSLCRELSEQQNVKIDFRTSAIPKDLPREIALCLFRFLQEALQNAIKHSRTGRFEVSISNRSKQLELSVRDCGVGFDRERALESEGLGLTSMRERLKLVLGELSIQSQPGCGTLIRATVPLHISGKAAEA